MSIQRAFRLSDDADNALIDYAAEHHKGNLTQALNTLVLAGIQSATGKPVPVRPKPASQPGKPIDWDHIKREVQRIKDGVMLTEDERAERYKNIRGIWPNESMEEFIARRAREGRPIPPPDSKGALFAALSPDQLRAHKIKGEKSDDATTG